MKKLCLSLLFYVCIFKISGQPGSLDSSFGNNGIQTTSFFHNLNIYDEEGRVVLTSANGDFFAVIGLSAYTAIAKYLPNGRLDSSYGNAGYSKAVILSNPSAVLRGDKVILAGYTIGLETYTRDFTLVRYTADGILDSSFGVDGRVITDFNNSEDEATSIALQGDRIIVGGYTTSDFEFGDFDFALARYTANGILDSSFGANGILTTDFNNSNDEARSIAIQGNKIIAAGSNNGDFALARYTANGVLDSAFGVNGIITADFNNSEDEANAIAVQGNRIIVAGYTYNPNSSNDFALARYTADGVLDASFGENGKATTDFNNSSDDHAKAVVLQGDKIIVTGYTGDPGTNTSTFALIRYMDDGALDLSFGKKGKVTTNFNNQDYANAIALQGDKIIVGGSTTNLKPYFTDLALARYTANGALDASFGQDGKLTDYIPLGQTYFTSTAIQGSKIVAAGYAFINNDKTDFVLARYTADGVLDASFGENGKVITDFSGYAFATSVAVQGNKIIVGGYAFNPVNRNEDFALARYTDDGTLDSSFGVNGIITTDFNNSGDVANAIVLQGDKIILAGNITNPDYTNDFAIARYTADGVLDFTFGEHGKVTTDFHNHSYDIANSITLQGDKILVGGTTYYYDESTNFFALARYTANGVLDASFGVNGKVTTNFNNSYGGVNSIATQGNKIIIGGFSGDDFALARYTADGTLDSSFGGKGIVTTDFNNAQDLAYSMVVEGDKIILAGFSNNNFALARYKTDGVLDASFGENGKVVTPLGGSAFIQAFAVHQNRLYAVGRFTFQVNDIYGIVAAYQLEVPEPTISIADVAVQESKRLAIVTVRLSALVNQIVRVHYTTRDKTAAHSEDYLSVNGPLLFIPHFNTTAKVIIPIVDDNKEEGDEQFEIVLTKPWNATIQDSIGVVTIIDDDNALVTKQNTSLYINVSPNPAKNAFTIQLQSSNLKQSVSILVYDVSGRLIEEKTNIRIGQSFRLGEQYKAGTYIMEAVQGNQRTQTKVIKTYQ
ncbi:T9SS type A sorting domain-containing protein [Ilyomonas limi]|uniref:T9SS type A sorting domain-containing protein n=1 Tax=Ilyomonas limi TaxID=2575867 RepID=A0A4V5UU02_9BACT|nr:Calx-beta domain-containing protein [Ilyomonas limi]TKK65383.1 T9SS type A sorting domain-containing protein [Ilyomonas limi]